jgi:hypothetical protein
MLCNNNDDFFGGGGDSPDNTFELAEREREKLRLAAENEGILTAIEEGTDGAKAAAYRAAFEPTRAAAVEEARAAAEKLLASPDDSAQ